MTEIFTLTLSQMFVLFFFIALGYFLAKKKICPDNSATVLSKLEMYAILPAFSFSTFAERFTRDVVSEKLTTLLWSTLILVISGVVAYLVAKLFAKDKNTVAVYTYAFTIPNTGYMGYPLIGGVFGAAMLFDYMVFVIPFSIYIYSVAMYMLNPKREFSFKKLFNPSLIATIIGAVWGILGIPLPTVAVNILDNISACLGPLAMILTGFVLSRRPVKDLVKNPKMYLASVLRLIVFPIVFGGILWLLGADNYTVLLASLMLSLPMGLNNIVFPEAFGGDSYTGAQSCFVCNIMGIFTVPVMFALITSVLG